MEKQIILRHVSPEIEGSEVVSGQIIDGQFVPSTDLAADLIDLGYPEDELNLLEQFSICPNRHFVTIDHSTAFISRLILLPHTPEIRLYSNFVVFLYVS